MCSRRAVRTLSIDSSALGIVAALAFVLHLGFYEGFGYFRDELYFLACSRHLAWGYVDHPPGVAVVAWLSRAALGDTLLAVRFVPILFATAQVLLAGLTARAMGGRRFAQLLSAISVLAAPIYFGSYLNTDMFVNLGWSACAYVIARILAGGSPRLWVVVGLLAGLAFESKHAIVFFAAAFLAALLFAASNKNVVPGPGAYLLANVEYLGPLTFPLWAAGALWCAFSRAGRPFFAVPAECHLPIWMVRGPKAGSLQQLGPALKNWM